jgi:hypothetical protein
MLNNPDIYTQAGRMTAHARNQQDEARAQGWKDYHRKNRALENEADQAAAERLFQDGYTETRRT